MKTGIITLAISAILFTSCSKENLDVQSTNNTTQKLSASEQISSNGTYVSDWSQMGGWQHYDSAGFRIFYNQQSVPALTADVISNGVVATYAKLNAPSDPKYMYFTKPIMLPFYFLPPEERPANTFYWFDTNTPGTIRIGYRTTSRDETLSGQEGNLQFRYFVIPKEFLAAHNLDAATVKYHYTYQQLISLLGVKE